MALLIKGKGEKEGRRRGRKVEPKALAEIRELLGDTPRRRDLLIEFLHKIQDRHHCISAAHIVALAKEMNLPTTEIYEVATFTTISMSSRRTICPLPRSPCESVTRSPARCSGPRN